MTKKDKRTKQCLKQTTRKLTHDQHEPH